MVTARRRAPRGRLLAALAAVPVAAIAAGTAVAPAFATTTASQPVQVGLFGSQDPTYDGVFRQSLALLAYSSAGVTPPAAAVSWLVGQQCADGGFQAFRSSTSVACSPSSPSTYSGEDTNSTGIAAAALRAVGRSAAADRAVAWTLAAQNADGGFPYFVGGDSDANSTATVLFGTSTAGRTPASVAKGGVSAVHFLSSLQIGCAGAATDDDGGFAFQDYGSGLVDSDAASVQATLALSGAALPVAPATVSTDVPRATCPAPATPGLSAAELGAGHLARLLDAFSGAVPQFDYGTGSRVPGSVSLGDTAWAALSLAAVGVGRTQLDAALGVITSQAPPQAAAVIGTAAAATPDKPGELALAALAVHAGGGSASTVTAYVARIGATMRVAPVVASPTPSRSSTSGSTGSTGSTDPLATSGATPATPVMATGGALLLVLGALALLTTRRRGAHA